MFRFKQFTIHDEQCAMKVGTDGTLLGAWSGQLYKEIHTSEGTTHPDMQNSNYQPIHILDIGTGSGLIAIMLAQQLPAAQITAIDIDHPAVSQANNNFAACPWTNRLHAMHISLQDYNNQAQFGYQLIVSNPPYFVNSLKNPNAERQMARHTDTLSYDELILNSASLLTNGGILALILPIEAESTIRRLASSAGLSPIRITYVCTKAGKTPKRILIALQKGMMDTNTPQITTDTLCLIGKDNAPRSIEYQLLTRDFYL